MSLFLNELNVTLNFLSEGHDDFHSYFLDKIGTLFLTGEMEKCSEILLR